MRLATAAGRRWTSNRAIGSQKELARRCLDLKDQFRLGLKASPRSQHAFQPRLQATRCPVEGALNPDSDASISGSKPKPPVRLPYTIFWLLHLGLLATAAPA